MHSQWQQWSRQLAARTGSWLRRRSRSFIAASTELLFPPVCLVCDRLTTPGVDGAVVCNGCRRALVDDRPACRKCARPLPPGLEAFDDSCGGCRGKKFRFEQAIALGVYGEELRDVVIRMKQTRDEPLALAMGRLLAVKCQQRATAAGIDFVAPVPMHWQRRLWRGGNAPELLGEAFAAILGKPLLPRLLRCRRRAKKQGTLLPTERRQNVRRAYQVSKGYDIRGSRVLLVDDVMTTGATANEIARTLRHGGADGVVVAVVARGIGFE